MPRPFVLVEINDGIFHDSTVIGVVDLEVFVIDWDEIDGNATLATEKRDEIVAKFEIGEGIGGQVSVALSRLQEIIEEGDEYYDDELDDDGLEDLGDDDEEDE